MDNPVPRRHYLDSINNINIWIVPANPAYGFSNDLNFTLNSSSKNFILFVFFKYFPISYNISCSNGYVLVINLTYTDCHINTTTCTCVLPQNNPD